MKKKREERREERREKREERREKREERREKREERREKREERREKREERREMDENLMMGPRVLIMRWFNPPDCLLKISKMRQRPNKKPNIIVP